MNLFLTYLLSAIPLGMTFLYGSTGEILTEKAGHLNLGVPGIMCVGGLCGCFTVDLLIGTVPPVWLVTLAILASFAGGVLMGLLYSFITVSLHANQNVTGLAMTIFGAGLSKYGMYNLTKGLLDNEASTGEMVEAVKKSTFLDATAYFRYPFANNEKLQYCGVMLFLAILIALICSWVLKYTRVGLHLRAVGENPATADAMGINVTGYKYVATCIGCGIAAMGGLYYAISYAGTAGAYKDIEALGWLSIALVIFALWRPHLSILGSILFGLLYVANSYLPQLFGWKTPLYATYLFKMLPYVVTIVVLIISSVRKKREDQPPASLGLSYFREER